MGIPLIAESETTNETHSASDSDHDELKISTVHPTPQIVIRRILIVGEEAGELLTKGFPPRWSFERCSEVPFEKGLAFRMIDADHPSDDWIIHTTALPVPGEKLGQYVARLGGTSSLFYDFALLLVNGDTWFPLPEAQMPPNQDQTFVAPTLPIDLLTTAPQPATHETMLPPNTTQENGSFQWFTSLLPNWISFSSNNSSSAPPLPLDEQPTTIIINPPSVASEHSSAAAKTPAEQEYQVPANAPTLRLAYDLCRIMVQKLGANFESAYVTPDHLPHVMVHYQSLRDDLAPFVSRDNLIRNCFDAQYPSTVNLCYSSDSSVVTSGGVVSVWETEKLWMHLLRLFSCYVEHP